MCNGLSVGEHNVSHKTTFYQKYEIFIISAETPPYFIYDKNEKTCRRKCTVINCCARKKNAKTKIYQECIFCNFRLALNYIIIKY